jgi:hypothetical protein
MLSCPSGFKYRYAGNKADNTSKVSESGVTLYRLYRCIAQDNDTAQYTPQNIVRHGHNLPGLNTGRTEILFIISFIAIPNLFVFPDFSDFPVFRTFPKKLSLRYYEQINRRTF